MAPDEGPTEERQSLAERVRQANAPGPPENSVSFRLVTTFAVVTGILACEHVGELSLLPALAACVAVVCGMAYSYAVRSSPRQWLKIVLALAVVGVFCWFVEEILHAARSGQLSSIEVPLAGLFTWVQVVHAFDVPSRRDLLFSLAAAGALVTVAGAQAVSEGFLGFVALLLVVVVVGLSLSWRSMSGGEAALSPLVLGSSLLLVTLVAVALVAVLPAPRPSQQLSLPSSIEKLLPVSENGIVNGSGKDAAEPARAGKAGGRIGVGGYVGFAGALDTADRDSLSQKVIMRVRADRPGYFLGLTYDSWNGQSWTNSRSAQQSSKIEGGSPFELPGAVAGGAYGERVGSENVQTFYVETGLPNILFSTTEPAQVYFPSASVSVGRDGAVKVPDEVTAGTVYTVVSADNEVSPTRLAADRLPLTPEMRRLPVIRAALALPYSYPRVAALARRIVSRAGAETTGAEVIALEDWIGKHTEYTTDIPPLEPGQDAVDAFLFQSRKGYCEQISTALAVMLRTLGVPTREAIGYVPGGYDPLSDMYLIRADDAHAWVQVYFPGYGWQSFDPTVKVPLAPESPGSVLGGHLLSFVKGLPPTPLGAVGGTAAGGVLLFALDRRRRRRPRSPAARAASRLERIGKRRELVRLPGDTLGEYAARLDDLVGTERALELAVLVEKSAYSKAHAPTFEKGEARRLVSEIARASRRQRRGRLAARLTRKVRGQPRPPSAR